MQPKISVIICTHNPRRDYIERVLEALLNQSLDKKKWELLLIDNRSEEILSDTYDLSWHFNSRIIREENLGLTFARIKGINSSTGKIIVFVDDDNVLKSNYLENVHKIFNKYNNIGAIGGKAIPEYEVIPEPWFEKTGVNLGCRDLGDNFEIIKSDKYLNEYPMFSPIGSGFAITKDAADFYVTNSRNDKKRMQLGRKGKELVSGEDNDINLTLLKSGWDLGYFPELQLIHLIPERRLKKNYLASLNKASTRSWVNVLDIHGIRPWPKISKWTVLPRKIKSFFHYKPWKNPESYIKWYGVCGQYEGRADIN